MGTDQKIPFLFVKSLLLQTFQRKQTINQVNLTESASFDFSFNQENSIPKIIYKKMVPEPHPNQPELL